MSSAMLRIVVAGLVVATLGAAHVAADGPAELRLHGTVEPLRSHTVVVPRLTGSTTGTLVIVHLVKPGTVVKRGDLLIEFDRQAQVKTAHDREAEYRDFLEQINKKRGEQLTSRAHDEAELKTASNAVKHVELEMLKKEIVPPITAEQNTLSLEEARAKLQQLQRTFDLKRRADAADLRNLEIQRDRAQNAWRHAESNAVKMRVVAPIDGMVVLKTTWKQGTMGEVQEGEDVRSGLPILDVVDPSEMRVRARINQADVDRVRVGQSARITLDSYPARTFRGRLDQLSRVGATSSLSNRVRTFLAVFSLEGTDPHLMPDLGAAIDLSTTDTPSPIARNLSAPHAGPPGVKDPHDDRPR
jgi:HlyD family secretion protein